MAHGCMGICSQQNSRSALLNERSSKTSRNPSGDLTRNLMRLLACCTRKALVTQRRCRAVTILCCALLTAVWLALVNSGLEFRDLPSIVLDGGGGGGGDYGGSEECVGRGGDKICVGFATKAFGSYSYWEMTLQRDRAPGCSSSCRLVSDPSAAHGLLFHAFDLPSRRRLRRMRAAWPREQFWIYYSLESPVHLVTNRCVRNCQFDWPLVGGVLAYAKELVFPSYLLRLYPDTTEEAGYFNWTVTYRRDSTVYSPYARYGKIEGRNASSSSSMSKSRALQPRWFAEPRPALSASSKRHLSFIVVSNCHPYNKRQEILDELGKHMELHIYGSCGDRKFPAGMTISELSRSYYFHLSFENAFCRDYITEKFFENGLNGFSVPVVFGGYSKSDYADVAPPNSFIYAGDFPTGVALATRLKRLSENPRDYAAYHAWRATHGPVDSGVSRQLNLFCQLCDRLRLSLGRRAQPLDLNKFYNSGAQCRPVEFDPFAG